nr:glycosyltransferase family A protein [uncultured Rhodopila sp.]
MTTRPEVSVIIPTRDALDRLPAAVASIGPNPNLEILIVDDGSTDGTLAWLGELAVADHRVRFMHGSKTGPSRARNLAIGAARAPLVAFLDADDRWLPGKLDAQLALHRAHPEIGLSFTDYRHINARSHDRGGCFAHWPRFAARLGTATEPFILARPVATLYAEHVVGTSTVMARTDLLQQAGGFNTGLASAEDWDMWLTLAGYAPVGVVPNILADNLVHRPGNVTGRMDLRVMAMRIIAERHRAGALAEDPNADTGFKARIFAARAEIAAANGHCLRSLALRIRALAYQPTRRGAYDLMGAIYQPSLRSA